MTTEDGQQETTYWSRELAALLQIGDSTLRKWCRVLEAQGYRFIRDGQDRRAFTAHDVLALRYVKELAQDKGTALESAAKAAAARFDRVAAPSVAPGATRLEERHADTMQRLLEHAKQQEQFNQHLLQELADHRRYIEESLGRRDELLMRQMRETLQTRKELAAAKRKWWAFWAR